MQYNIEALVRLGILQIQSAYGYNQQPVVSTGTVTADTGEFYYAFKAIDGDAVISSVKDLQGNAVAGLAGVTIKQGDYLQFPATEIVLTSGKIVVYPVQKVDNLLP